MRIPILPFLIFAAIAFAVDLYLYIVAVKRCESKVPSRLQLYSAITLYAFLFIGVILPMRSGASETLVDKMWILFAFFSALFPKILFVVVDLLAIIPCLFNGKRSSLTTIVGGILSLLLFIGMWWGALINRFRIEVNPVEITIPRLPKTFDGYKIVQISDLHVGTFGADTAYVSQVVKTINNLEPDMIVITGDIVNRYTDEILPFVNTFKKMWASDGVYSVLGNHDYGDYYNWNSAEEKEQNKNKLINIQQEMGWSLLLNQHEFVHRDNDSIAIIGVENVGDPPFTVYGDLEASYPSLSDVNTKILLSHNPAHWTDEIANDGKKNIALTLSGHTHAMQVDLFGLSPAVFRYPKWGGLYVDDYNLHQLYVNIGIGTVAFPMRLGATPEVTLITLRCP